MMNWYRFSYILLAILACSIVALDSRFSHSKPSFAAICGWPSYPKRTVSAAHACISTIFRTVFRLSVLSNQPLFFSKYLSALATSKLNPISPSRIIRPAYLFTSKCVCRALALSKFITDLVVVRHATILHMPLTATLVRTKTRIVFPIWLYLKLFTTNFASQCNHISIIPHSIGVGTMQIRMEI